MRSEVFKRQLAELDREVTKEEWKILEELIEDDANHAYDESINN